MALSTNKEEQYQSARNHLELVMKAMNSMRIGKKSTWKPVQTGIIFSTTTVLNLCDELLDSNLDFLLTSRLTQDCVENLFSVVRSRHPTPTAREFKYALKLICTAQYLKPVKSGNYHLDDRQYLGDLLPDRISPPTLADLGSDDIEFTTAGELNTAEENSLYYLAGYCVHSLQRLKRLCGKCLESLKHKEEQPHSKSSLLRLKNFKDGALFEVNETIYSML